MPEKSIIIHSLLNMKQKCYWLQYSVRFGIGSSVWHPSILFLTLERNVEKWRDQLTSVTNWWILVICTSSWRNVTA